MGNYGLAAQSYREALALEPGRSELYKDLGNSLLQQEKLTEALEAFQQAVRLRPTDPEAYGGLASTLKVAGRLDDALAAVNTALSMKPDYIGGHQCRVYVLTAMGDIDEAIASQQRVNALQPDDSVLASSVPATIHYSPRFDQQALCNAAKDWARRFAEPLYPAHPQHANERNPHRRLRIGYASPDFHGHPVAFNLLPLFRERNRSSFEIFCYAQEPTPDEVTLEFQRLSDHWRNVLGQSDEEVTGLVRADGIDIFVDLALHTAGNRMLVFARKPAPVQVTFAGYPGTTGLSTIDYRLTDPHLDPPERGPGCYAEKSWRLPETFWCYDPLAHAFPVNDLPALVGGNVTFGCLNNFCKINPGVVALWSRVLKALPDSRLMLLTGEGSHRERTRRVFESHGISGERISFERYRPRIEYLELYRQIDIGLDTLPYNGHTTSLDSFWMGVPVITFCPPDATVVGRAGVSQLTNLGLTDMIARTPEQFEQIAVALAQDLPRLAALRTGLRERMRKSPLIDGRRFAHAVEAAYREMWQRWCAS